MANYQDIAECATKKVNGDTSHHDFELSGDGVLHINGQTVREVLSGRPLRPTELIKRADKNGKQEENLPSYAENILWNALDRFQSEGHTCPRRGDPGPWRAVENLDYWEERPNGDRCCSFCGSLHFKDFMNACQDVIESESIKTRLSASDKRHKVYVKRADVQNATEGGIKFYKWHTPQMGEKEASQATAIFRQALSISDEKFGTFMQKMKRERWGDPK